MSVASTTFLASAVIAWPLAVLAWSLPDRWFDPGTLSGIPRVWMLISLALPVLCALWASATVPDHALPGAVVLGWGLIALAIIDARTFILPDGLTLPLAAIGLGHAAWINTIPGSGMEAYAIEAGWGLVAAIVGFLFMALVARTFRAVRGIEGLGLGDAKLFAATGAWLGLGALPTVILVAAVAALVTTVAAHRLVRSGSPIGTTPIPFGPYLAGATWLVALYGPLALM